LLVVEQVWQTRRPRKPRRRQKSSGQTKCQRLSQSRRFWLDHRQQVYRQHRQWRGFSFDFGSIGRLSEYKVTPCLIRLCIWSKSCLRQLASGSLDFCRRVVNPSATILLHIHFVVARHTVNRHWFCYSTSNYSNVSAVTPTSVLPAVGSRDNHLWNHSYYVKVRNLREGSSGSVHLVVDLRYGNQVAIKFIPRGSNR